MRVSPKQKLSLINGADMIVQVIHVSTANEMNDNQGSNSSGPCRGYTKRPRVLREVDGKVPPIEIQLSVETDARGHNSEEAKLVWERQLSTPRVAKPRTAVWTPCGRSRHTPPFGRPSRQGETPKWGGQVGQSSLRRESLAKKVRRALQCEGLLEIHCLRANCGNGKVPDGAKVLVNLLICRERVLSWQRNLSPRFLVLARSHPFPSGPLQTQAKVQDLVDLRKAHQHQPEDGRGLGEL